jgi:phosphoglycolate phosphatase-like HAD superfamily hydrolase
MLRTLTSAGLPLGIVTSNVRANIESALGRNMRFFRPDCILTKDAADWDSKADALIAATKRLNAAITTILYVGDQPADWLAAKEAGARFLGVSYGWGISQQDKEFPVVKNVMDIAEYVLNGARSEPRPARAASSGGRAAPRGAPS